MDNQTLNWTLDYLCISRLYQATGIMVGTAGIVSFPTSLIVVIELLKRIFERRKNHCGRSIVSPSEAFLLHVNLINLCGCLGSVLYLLATTGVCEVNDVFLMVLFWPRNTAKPMFVLGICATVYLAVVRPVAYRNATRHFECVFTTFTWLYSSLMKVMCVTFQLDDLHPIPMLSFCITLAPVVFFNVSTLRALTTDRRGRCGRMVDPAKKRVFLVVLSILLVMLMYFVPNIYMFIYCFIHSMDMITFMCKQFQFVVIPVSAEVLMPLIFLYSFGKVSVPAHAPSS